MRQRANQKLGTKFDIRDFNDALLRDGVLPLDLLCDEVNQYISERQGRCG